MDDDDIAHTVLLGILGLMILYKMLEMYFEVFPTASMQRARSQRDADIEIWKERLRQGEGIARAAYLAELSEERIRQIVRSVLQEATQELY